MRNLPCFCVFATLLHGIVTISYNPPRSGLVGVSRGCHREYLIRRECQPRLRPAT